MLRCYLLLRHWRPSALCTKPIAHHVRYNSSSALPTELSKRGLLADLTITPQEFITSLKKPRTIYCGVDPTAGSLHVGNLIPLLVLLHFQLRGHQTIALLGGATALIGDPSGRDEERPVQAPGTIHQNVIEIEKQLSQFFENAWRYAEKRCPYTKEPRLSVDIVNNLDWWQHLSIIDFLQTTGKNARVSSMLSKESVKNRMGNSSGISFSEFSYQLLQAHDFWHLYKNNGCSIQVGGSDQWGNIVAGLDLIDRREANADGADGFKACGLTTPLITTSSGKKFGKSAGNAVWLNRQKTSVFDFYQFFMRTNDMDVEKYLKLFTLLGLEDIKAVMQTHMKQPELRSAQRKLAEEVTEMIHGGSGLIQAQAATSLLFDTELTNILAEDAAEALRHDSRYHALPAEELLGIRLTKLAASSGLVSSHKEALRLVDAGGLYMNNIPVSGPDRKLQADDLLGNRLIIMRAGKDKHVVMALK